MSDEDLAQEKKYLWGKRHEVLHRAQLSAQYHRAEERRLDFFDRMSKFATLVAGSAALASAINHQVHAGLLAAVAILSALSLAFAFAERARRHADLASKWTLLEGDILRTGERDYTEPQINEWHARQAEIEAAEPPASSNLVSVIQHRIAVSEGRKDAMRAPSRWERLLGHLGI